MCTYRIFVLWFKAACTNLVNFIRVFFLFYRPSFLVCVNAVLKREFILTTFALFVIQSKKKKRKEKRDRPEFISQFLMKFS